MTTINELIFFVLAGDHSEIFEYKKMRSLSLEMIK